MREQSEKRPPPKQLKPWQPGESGNPAGRPKGARNKLGEAFIADLYESWKTKGTEVINRVIAEKPEQYLKVVASILPKEFHVKDDAAMSEEQIADIIATIRSEQAKRRAAATSRAVDLARAAQTARSEGPDSVH